VADYICRHLNDVKPLEGVSHTDRALAARLLRRPLLRKPTLSEFTSYGDELIPSGNGNGNGNGNTVDAAKKTNANGEMA
jgi:hypothetical protein